MLLHGLANANSKIMLSLIFAFSFCTLSRSYFHLLADMGHSGDMINYRESDRRLGRMHDMKCYD